jgi:hypothetical protein
MGSWVRSRGGHITLSIFILLGAGIIASPAAADQFDGTIPSAEENLPGVLVRYVELEENEVMDWSWRASSEVDFVITIPSRNETILDRPDQVSQGGDLKADHSAIYMFAWYNEDPDHDKEISYTIHRVQTEPVVIGILAIGVVSFLVFVYVLWYSTRGYKKVKGPDGKTPESRAQAPREPPEGPKKVAAVGMVVSLIAISVTFLVFLPQEGLDTEKGSELVLSIDNGAAEDHVVWVTTSEPGGVQVQFDKVTIAAGATGKVLILASPEWTGTSLTVEFNDRTADTKSTESWTPTTGQRDEMTYDIP